MKVLLVKTSSLGDVIHLLPAVTEAAAARPELKLHWMVEPAYAEIPAWHRAVQRVVPVPFRHWRGRRLAMLGSPAWTALRQDLRRQAYDAVIDAQGLVKSAWLSTLARAPRIGPDRASAREPLASLLYRQRVSLPAHRHAVDRLRCLLAAALDYALPAGRPDYGLEARVSGLRAEARTDRVLFLHGSAWGNKRWPEPHWIELGRRLRSAGLRPALPWGDRVEHSSALRMAAGCDGEVLPRLGLGELLAVMAQARAVVGVDSGLLHLATAAGVPGVGLFGPTDPERTGAWGGRVRNLMASLPCAPCGRRHCRSNDGVALTAGGEALEPPCLGGLAPERVFRTLEATLAMDERAL